ncbi:hypothetical protein HID58_032280 [Brassica napus]|uniref:Protein DETOXIFICATION n=1 Tax=Brassica napus TaxID=3708 RepID=A0ABQ8BVZ2_BRANA|nr:hypothetical protein HID58_032280 [Brassica napus]
MKIGLTMGGRGGGEELESLLKSHNPAEEDGRGLKKRVWVETKKLWQIVGPAMFSRLTSYSMLVITQAFAGHLGDLELAAISIVNNVIIGFNLGLLLGMASALETLCGQAFGAKKYHIVLGLFSSFVVFYYYRHIFSQLRFSNFLANQTISLSFLVLSPFGPSLSISLSLCLSRFNVTAYSAAVSLVVHFLVCWLFVNGLKLGVVGTMATISISWWVNVFITLAYSVCGGCPLTWTGLSSEAFTGLWEFLKLSASSGVMLCLENWYYRILIIVTGNLQNAQIAVDSFMAINGWEMMIPLAFFAGTGMKPFTVYLLAKLIQNVNRLLTDYTLRLYTNHCSVRVANELGAGNGKGARFATIVSVTQSLIIGLFFGVIIMLFHNQIAWIFSSSEAVLVAVNKLSILLAFTVLLNSIQPVLSGVAVGSGWQSYVAYINLGCYYCIGLPFGFLMGWVFKFGVMGIWAGMIFGGTAVQTLILCFITLRCDWEKEAQKANARVNKWSSTIK